MQKTLRIKNDIHELSMMNESWKKLEKNWD